MRMIGQSLHKLIIVGAFVLLSLIQYFPSIGVYFLSDDFIWLYQAEQAAPSSLLVNYIDADNFFYRPTTKAYFYFAYRIFGMDPAPYHLVQIVLHGINAALIFLLAQRIFVRTRFAGVKGLLAGVVAGVFVVHPIHTEVVLWISAITEMIPAFCILLSMWILARYPKAWMITVLLYIVAMGSHEYAIVMPLILAVWQVYLASEKNFVATVREVGRQNSILYVVLGMVGVAYLILRYLAGSHWQGGDYSYNILNLPFNLIGNALAYGIFAVVGPDFYPYYAAARIMLRQNLLIAGGLVVVGVVGVWSIRKAILKKHLLLLTSIFLLGVAAFLPLGTIAERYIYFSAWIFYAALIWAIYYGLSVIFKSSAKREFLGVALFLMGLFSVLTYRSFENWHGASAEVRAITGFFETQCDSFYEDEIISLDSPVNRIGRAWVFQVGVEEAASLICDKRISIIRM